jgi:hypothetical protein
MRFEFFQVGRATHNEFEPPCLDSTSLRSNIRARRASSSAILLRRDSRSDMSQGISFRASFGERILIPLTGGKCFGFDVMIG